MHLQLACALLVTSFVINFILMLLKSISTFINSPVCYIFIDCTYALFIFVIAKFSLLDLVSINHNQQIQCVL